MNETLSVGDRVRLSGGYDMEPRWLKGQFEYTGRVARFIPGQNESPAVVIELESPISVDGVIGNVLILELRYSGAQWEKINVVHVELCDFDPEARAWQHRRQGKWIESHASCERI